MAGWISIGFPPKWGQVEAVNFCPGIPLKAKKRSRASWYQMEPFRTLLAVERLEKKKRQIEVEVVFKKGQPSLISFGNDAIVNPMRSSLRNASDEEF